MPLILVGERGSPHVEQLEGVAVGFDESHGLQAITTLEQLAPRERHQIADRLELLTVHLRNGLVKPLQ